ncbi:MAG TPA: TetR/AcrR family transcriptional regulator [Opitutaceae bacterium]|nr:TetR/AcrR family transcriptional regulator [Opitutaceae bacterium]
MGRTSDASERLKDAALDLMWEESYGAVTIDDICKRAEVKKGSFYYFFSSKAELAVAALEKMWERDWQPKLDRLFSSSLDPLARFSGYLTGIYESQAAMKAKSGKVLGCPVCTVGSEVSTQEIDVSAKVREITARKRRYYESTIRDAIAAGVIESCDPAQKTLALVGLIEGIVSQARIMNDPEIIRDLPAMAFGLLGVKKSAAVSPEPVLTR